MVRIGLWVSGILVTGGALWLLPTTVDSWLTAILIVSSLALAVFWGVIRRDWRAALVLGTFLVLTDMFGIVRSSPNALWLIMALVWVGGTWFIGYVGDAQQRLFHQALASFLVLEMFLALQLWPVNVVSKAVIIVAFGFLLWNELVRTVPALQRVRESVLPFTFVVALMTLTGQWLTF